MSADVVISAYKRTQSFPAHRDGSVSLQIERPPEPFYKDVVVGLPLPSMLNLAGLPSQLNVLVTCSEVYWHP